MPNSPESRIFKLEGQMTAVIAELQGHTTVLGQVTENVQTMSAKLDRIDSNTKDTVAFFQGAQTGARAFLWLGKAVKWGGGVLAAAAAIWYFVWGIKNGHPFQDHS